MKAIRLTLIAHARTSAQKCGRFAEDEEIEGVEPEKITALRLRVGSYQGLLCGPERRTRQTAALLTDEFTVEPALGECDFADWRGVSLKTLQERDPRALEDWLSHSGAAPYGGESVDAVCARVGEWLDGFRQPGHWVAVTHPFVIRAALVHALQCAPASGNQIDVEPLSVVELSYYGTWRLRV